MEKTVKAQNKKRKEMIEMNKKIRIIDLLNMIANEEEVPYIIYYNGDEYKFCYDIGDYRKYGYNECLLIKSIFGTFDCCGKHNSLYNMLFDEVEIIEEPKKIEKIKFEDRDDALYAVDDDENYYCIDDVDELLINYINKIIDVLNERGKDE